MRSRRVLVLITMLLSVVFPATGASALFEVYQPDVFVKRGTGEGIHDAAGVGQIREVRVHRGREKLLDFWNRNDGNTTDRFTYQGCSGRGWVKVRWLDWADADVTAETTAGTFTTPPLDAGVSEGMLTLDVTVKPSALSGRHLKCTVLATSAGNATQDRAGYRIVVP